LILLVSNVFGLGLAPAKSTFDYKANSVKEGALRIIVDNVPSKVILTTEGELGQYIELDQEVLVVTETETWVKFKMKLPKNMNPGEQSGGILVLEVPKSTGDGNVVMAAPAVIHKVKVNVPYPGKYVTGKMYITNIEVNEPILFTLALKNFGIDDVDNAKATIVIKGPTNEEIGVLHTEEISINANTEGKLTGFWKTENPGTYFVEAAVEYDGKVFEMKEKFDVGNLDIEIENLLVNNFKIGQIAKLDIYLRNKWNEPINIQGKVDIFKDDKLVSSFNTIPIIVNEKSTSIMEAYWNTQDIEVGEYDISVKANYKGKTAEKSFNSIVSIDKIQVKDYVSGQVTGDGNNRRTTLLVLAVLVLIGLNIALFIYISKKLKSKQPPPPKQQPRQQFQQEPYQNIK